MNDAKKPFMKFLVERMPAESFPIEGYEAPVNFPNESIFHKSAFEDAIKWFEKFPDCCNPHRDMAAEGRVKKSDYEGLPKKILDGLSFTEHFITTRIDTPNWFAEITDYIDYVRWNFGSLEIGLHKYDHYLKHFIEGSKNIIPELKRQRLIEYIEDCNKPINPEMALENDLEIIYDTLQKWVKTFPFELPYFKGLKVQFEGKIPVFKEPARLNPYTGMKKGKGWTRTELVDVLAVITKRLLDGVQADKMLKEGQILDISKHRLEIANEKLRVDNAKLLRDYSEGELRYVDTLKRWLKRQRAYFKEVVDILGKQSATPTTSKEKGGRQPSHDRTFQSLFKDIPTMERLLAAAVSVGLIARDGDRYTWIEEGAKSHRICALWFTAVDAGMTKAKLKNTEATTKAIQKFFGMDSLSKDTIDEVKRHNDEYKRIKSTLEKKLKE